MTLINRISRLFKADVHGILDAIEEPEAMLKQAFREMEEVLFEQSRKLEEVKQRQEVQAREKEETQQSIRELAQSVALCFESGNETLAKNLVRKKLEMEHVEKEHTQRSESLLKEREILERSIAERSMQLKELTEKHRVLTGELKHSRTGSGSLLKTAVSEEDVEVAFLREKRRFSEQSAGRSEASALLR